MARELTHACSADDAHSVACVLVGIKTRDLGTGDSIHHALRHLEHRDVEVQIARRGCHFEPDVSAADDHKSSPGREVATNTLDIGNGTKEVNAVEVMSGHRKCARA